MKREKRNFGKLKETYSGQVAFPAKAALAVAHGTRSTERISATFGTVERNVIVLPTNAAPVHTPTAAAAAATTTRRLS